MKYFCEAMKKRSLRTLLVVSTFCLGVSLTAQQQASFAELDSLVAEGKRIYFTSPEASMSLGKEIVELSEEAQYQRGKLEGLRLIGNSHYLLGRMDSAAFYMLALLDLAYDVNDVGMQADVMIDIGQTYDKIGMHSLAYDYFWQAHQIRLQTNDAERLSVTFINLAYHYYLRDELDTALYFYDRTAEILDTMMTHTNSFLYNQQGGVYLKQGRYDDARHKIEKAMVMNLEEGNNWDLSYNHTLMAQLELELGDVAAAERNALEAIRISEESGIAIELDLIYKVLSEVKTRQGYFRQALGFLNKSYTYADSLELVLTDQKFLALDHYKNQKENEISTLKLKAENLSQKVQIGYQRNMLIGMILTLLLALGSLGFVLRQNNKLKVARKKINHQNEDLQQLNTTKNKLISIITHDIRNPLSNINGMLKLARDGLITPDEFNQYAGSLVDQTDRLETLSETLIKWSRSQEKGLVATMELVDLDQLIKQSIQYVAYMADNKEVELHYQTEATSKVRADANMMMLILNNLLTNAIKFTPSGGKVSVTLEEGQGALSIAVTDTGVGIDPDIIQKLREGALRPMIGTANEKGTGIGLLLTLDLITLMGGTLDASQNPDGGSTFIVVLEDVEKRK